MGCDFLRQRPTSINKEEAHRPRFAHLSKTAIGYLQMPCNILPVLPLQLIRIVDGLYKQNLHPTVFHRYIQSNLKSSNTDGSFTMANSNSFLSPYEILPIDQENNYLRKLSYFIMKLYVVPVYSLESPL